MRIFALGDPHLSFDEQGVSYKPMDIFGPHWQDHSDQLALNWRATVTEEDAVLVGGDISWAMTLAQARRDLDFLHQLPGRKIIIRGNHDLWWDTIAKVRRELPPSIAAIQNDHVVLGGAVICGTKGWPCPEGEFADAHDGKIFAREVGRLRLSLASVQDSAATKIVLLHYPPTSVRCELSPFVEAMLEYGVTHCVYGHLHNTAIGQNILPEEKWGIAFHLTSADYLQFTPKLIGQF